MNWHKSKGFSLLEVLAGAALVALWSVSSLKLLHVGLSAIEKAAQKAQAAELLVTYQIDAQKIWALGGTPSSVIDAAPFLITSEVKTINPFNATTKVTVSWGKDNQLTQTFWLSR